MRDTHAPRESVRNIRQTHRQPLRQTAHLALAVAVILAWLISGPIFILVIPGSWSLTPAPLSSHFDGIFNSKYPNRDTEALQLKLDELIRATRGAHNALLDLEELELADMEDFKRRYIQLAKHARAALESGEDDTDTPEAV